MFYCSPHTKTNCDFFSLIILSLYLTIWIFLEFCEKKYIYSIVIYSVVEAGYYGSVHDAREQTSTGSCGSLNVLVLHSKNISGYHLSMVP